MGEMKNAYILVQKSQRKGPRSRWKDAINIILRGIRCEIVD
jgi:hypothetical protein